MHNCRLPTNREEGSSVGRMQLSYRALFASSWPTISCQLTRNCSSRCTSEQGVLEALPPRRTLFDTDPTQSQLVYRRTLLCGDPL